MTTTTPLIYETKNLKLSEFFSTFESIGIFGIDFTIRQANNRFLSYYSCTLSALSIDLSKNTTDRKNYLPESDNYPNLNDDQSIIDFINTNYKLETSEADKENIFFENQPIMNRLTFKDKFDEFIYKNPELKDLTLNDISNKSWFAILWSPSKSSYGGKNNVSFLIFYEFRDKVLSESIKFLKVKGIITSKISNDKLWFLNYVDSLGKNIDVDFFHNRNMFYSSNVSLNYL